MFRFHPNTNSDDSFVGSHVGQSDDPITQDKLSEIPNYHVSEEFNSRLLNRIAEERYAEVRTKAFMPRHAPQFTWGQAVPVFATLALVAFVAVGVMKDFSSDTPSTELATIQHPTVTQSLASSTSTDVPLGVSLGLTDEYMTAQPVDNPTYASGQSTAAGNADESPGDGAMLTSSGSSSRYYSNMNWQFEQQMQRARRIAQISNSLGSGHAYFEVVRYHYQLGNGETGVMIRLNPMGVPVIMQDGSQAQIIIRSPQSLAPAQNNPLRTVSGSF